MTSYRFLIRAAVKNWSVAGDDTRLFSTRIHLKDEHVDSLIEYLMPVIEKLLKEVSK